MGKETEFKNWWRRKFDGWSEVYEPRMGSSSGIPDVQALVGGVLLPIEFKIGVMRKGILHCKFEPAQPSWHIRFLNAGGKALICVGISNGKGWKALAVRPGSWLIDWERGVPNDVVSEWTIWHS